jgi:hypothetical protein
MARDAPPSPALVRTGVLVIALGLGLAPRAIAADRAPAPFELTIDTHQVLMPAPGASELDDRRVAMDPARGAYAVRVEVRAQDPAAPWKLYVRADGPTFRSEGSGKPCHDLRWKFDHEGAGAYRALEDQDAIVLERPGGGSTEIAIDLLVDLDWTTPPGMYGLGLVFSLVSE